MPSTAFLRACSITLVNEGGPRVVDATVATPNNPNLFDKGTISKYGITLATLSSYRGKPCTHADVKNLMQPEAEVIYEKLYWRPIKGDDFVCPYLAAAVFDAGVLTGPGNATKMLQGIVNVLQDGAIGPVSLKAINAAEPAALIRAFSRAWQAYLLAIVERDRTQAVFLVGWLRRAAIIQSYTYVF